MSNEIIKANNKSVSKVPVVGAMAIIPRSLDEVQRWAKMFAASGFFDDARDVAQASVKIMAGAELGFSPIQSMTGIHIIRTTNKKTGVSKTNITVGAHLLASAIVRGGYDYEMISHDDKVCEIRFSRDGKELGTSRYTMDDANKAGLVKDWGNWSTVPRNMLYARAMSNGAKWYCAGAFAGAPVYVPEEFEGEEIELIAAPKQSVQALIKQRTEAREAFEAEIVADEVAQEEPEVDDEEYLYDGLVDEKAARLNRKKELLNSELKKRHGEHVAVNESQLELAD